MFNLRVYGLLIHNNQLLVCEEMVQGKSIVKFPGGGLEFGEGLLDCLRREFREELHAEIFNIRHFYTTDFFVRSFVDPTHQVISIYYLVDADIATLQLQHEPGLRFRWIALSTLSPNDLDLPIDKKVAELLKQHPTPIH